MDISGLKTNEKHCATCPFKPDPRQPGGIRDRELANAVISRNSLNASQICHGTEGDARQPKSLCRGHRDYFLDIFYRLGGISEPTDEAWENMRKSMD